MQKDPELGKKVHDHLVKLGLETPMTDLVHENNEDKMAEIEPLMKQTMEILGYDLTDDSLMETPKRVAKLWTKELNAGLDYNNFPKMTAVENKMDYHNSFVLEKNVTISSVCEHHIVVFDGLAAIAYIPKPGGKIIGLSKILRLASQFFSKRFQIQERLTNQIGEALSFITETDDIAVYINSVHFCIRSRGITDTNASTTTLFTKGRFAEDANIRKEFLEEARSK